MAILTRLIEFWLCLRSPTIRDFSISKMRFKMDQVWFKLLGISVNSSRRREKISMPQEEEEVQADTEEIDHLLTIDQRPQLTTLNTTSKSLSLR